MNTDKRLSLLYIVGQLTCGGLERQLYYLLSGLAARRHRTAMVVWNSSSRDVYLPKIRKLGVPVETLPPGLRRTEKLKVVRTLVREFRPQVVHSYSFYTNFAAWWASLGARSLPVGSIRSELAYAQGKDGRLLGALNSYLPRFQITNNRAVERQIRRSRSVLVPRRVALVQNALDVSQFIDLPSVDGDPLHLVGIGALSQVKRWDRLLELARQLKGRGYSFSVTVAGEGPLKDQLRGQAKTLGVADLVHFPGYVEDVAGLLARATLVVHTSESEGCPNAVMEAMAAGRAVVAIGVGDVASLIDDGENGFLVENDEMSGLVDRVSRLLSDSSLRAAMGRRARQKAESCFGMGHLVDDMMAAYRLAGLRNLIPEPGADSICMVEK